MPADRADKTNLLREYPDGSLASEQMSAAEQLLEKDPQAVTLIDEQEKIETFINRLHEALAMPTFPAEQNEEVTDAMRQAVAGNIAQPRNSDETAPADLKDTTTVPNGVQAVTRDMLKKYCVAKGWMEEAESNRARAKVSDMLNVLAGKNFIGLTNVHVWMP
jgi:anti-sigma factor RsiW